MNPTIKYYICPKCQGPVDLKLDTYTSVKKSPQTGSPIFIPDVKVMSCINNACGHTYLTRDEERRVQELLDQDSSELN